MKLVRERTTIPVPEVYGYACTASESPAQWPFILMSKAEGVQLNWKKITEKGKQKIMGQLADVVFQLCNISFGQIGSIVTLGNQFHVTRCIRRSFSQLPEGMKIDSGPFESTRAYYATLLSIFRKDILSPVDSSRLPFFRPVPHIEDFDTIDEYRAALSNYNDPNLHGSEDWNSPRHIGYYERLHRELTSALGDLVDLDSHVFVLEHTDLNPTNIFINPATLNSI